MWWAPYASGALVGVSAGPTWWEFLTGFVAIAVAYEGGKARRLADNPASKGETE